MNKDQWQIVKQLFDEALEQPTATRLTWLATKTDANGEVYKEVAGMLAADSTSQHGITDIVSHNAENAIYQRYALKPGDQLGAYRIDAPIGEGGMGAVFIAERTDQVFDHQVAIKIISGHSLNPDTIARFSRERQILAKLNHRNIARLIDGGTTESGLPYLVMDYVHGRSLFNYCTEARLTLEQKLQLFLQVCQAVIYAHQNLIVHRDIKSSNILVDEQGQVKLLDFGVAKMIEPDQQTAADQTQIEIRILTPRSASPEQVKGEAITTGTDVYALGALLYELLTGLPLFDTDNITRTELERLICEQAPLAPSEKVLETGKKSPEINALARSLKGDLDTIILTALAKDNRERYASVQALADDLERYLNHFPIHAKRQSKFYHAAKFLRRNALSSSLAGGLLLAVTLATGYIWLQAGELRQQRNQAQEQALIAGETTDFLVNVFEQADPYLHAGNVPTAIDLLNQGYESIDRISTGQAVKASLLTTLANIYLSLSEYDLGKKAIDQLGQILAQQESPDAAMKSNYHMALGTWNTFTGQYKEAITEQNLSLEWLAQAEGSTLEDYHDRQLEIASALTGMFHHQEVIDLLIPLLPEIESTGNLESLFLAFAQLGHAYRNLEEYEASLSFLQRALTLARTTYGDQHLETGYLLNQSASTLRHMGRPEEALGYALEGLEIRRIVHGISPDLGASLGLVSLIYLDLGEFDQAEAYRRECLDTLLQSVGDQHPYIAASYGSLASILAAKQDWPRAIDLYGRAITLGEQFFESDNPWLTRMYRTKSALERDYGNSQNALDLAQQALQRVNNSDGYSAQDIGKTHEALGRAYAKLGDEQSAANHLSQAIEQYHLESEPPQVDIEAVKTLLQSLSE